MSAFGFPLSKKNDEKIFLCVSGLLNIERENFNDTSPLSQLMQSMSDVLERDFEYQTPHFKRNLFAYLNDILEDKGKRDDLYKKTLSRLAPEEFGYRVQKIFYSLALHGTRYGFIEVLWKNLPEESAKIKWPSLVDIVPKLRHHSGLGILSSLWDCLSMTPVGRSWLRNQNHIYILLKSHYDQERIDYFSRILSLITPAEHENKSLLSEGIIDILATLEKEPLKKLLAVLSKLELDCQALSSLDCQALGHFWLFLNRIQISTGKSLLIDFITRDQLEKIIEKRQDSLSLAQLISVLEKILSMEGHFFSGDDNSLEKFLTLDAQKISIFGKLLGTLSTWQSWNSCSSSFKKKAFDALMKKETKDLEYLNIILPKLGLKGLSMSLREFYFQECISSQHLKQLDHFFQSPQWQDERARFPEGFKFLKGPWSVVFSRPEESNVAMLVETCVELDIPYKKQTLFLIQEPSLLLKNLRIIAEKNKVLQEGDSHDYFKEFLRYLKENDLDQMPSLLWANSFSCTEEECKMCLEEIKEKRYGFQVLEEAKKSRPGF